MRYGYALLICCWLLFPAAAFSEDVNAGFVRGLWFSSHQPFAEKPVRMYVAIRNNTGADLTGTVTFYANDERIGSQAVAALDNRLIESWIDWTPTYGTHTVRAELSRVKRSTVGSSSAPVAVAVATASDTIFVDYDSDGDLVGNNEDTDDDGDGVSDADEKDRGTDPLVKDVPVSQNQNENEDSEDTPNSPPPAASEKREGTVTTTTYPEGIERYLTPSPVDTALGSVARFAHQTKTQLDAYRLTQAQEDESIAAPVVVNSDGFGTITRSGDTPLEPTHTPTQGSWADKLFSFLLSLFEKIWSLVLWLLSWALGHPALLQLLLLLAILYGLFFAARLVGRRPSVKKKRA